MRALALFLSLWPAAAVADEADAGCARWRDPGLVEGPVAIGLFAGDLGSGRRACPRSEVAVGVRLGAIIDAPNYYGNLAVDGLLQGSLVLKERGELFFSIPFVDWQYVQNGPLVGSQARLGAMSVGGSVVAYDRRGLTLSPYARVLLPTDARTAGAEAGLAVSLRARRQLGGHAVVAADVAGGISGPVSVRAGALLIAGLEWTPTLWLALVVDLQAHLGAEAALDWLAPAASVRIRIWRSLGAELATVVPVAGADRHDVSVLFRLSVRM